MSEADSTSVTLRLIETSGYCSSRSRKRMMTGPIPQLSHILFRKGRGVPVHHAVYLSSRSDGCVPDVNDDPVNLEGDITFGSRPALIGSPDYNHVINRSQCRGSSNNSGGVVTSRSVTTTSGPI